MADEIMSEDDVSRAICSLCGGRELQPVEAGRIMLSYRALTREVEALRKVRDAAKELDRCWQHRPPGSHDTIDAERALRKALEQVSPKPADSSSRANAA